MNWTLKSVVNVAACGFAAVLCGCAQQEIEQFGPAAEAPGVVADDAAGAEREPPAEDDLASADRKIIYTATVNLVVPDFAAADRKIQSLARETGGFVAEFREDGQYGDRRSGRWVVRTPVKHFQKFLDEVTALGVPEMREISTQDVTEEYVDLEARLANKRKLEQRILDLLENQTGEIKDIIAVETELARVREEIERMEGRLRWLAQRVELTTVTIFAREEFDYVPPQAPTFAGKVQSTWSHSLAALGKAGEALALVIVAIVPWLAVLAILLFPLLIWWRLRRRRNPVVAEIIT
ncbi:MAG: DUF4349 domain-containing protein [Planctomycetes bacterium]|nr:DUF4349 domain-containing protein [Planctomycetota bacterium]